MTCKECGKEIRSVSKYGYCVKHRHLAKENIKRKEEWIQKNYKEKRNENSKKFYKKNKEDRLLYAKKYRKENKDKINTYRKNKYYSDLLFRVRLLISNRFRKFIKYDEKSIFEYTGYEKENYITILKYRFEIDYPNLSFEDCLFSGCWHIDHIVPISLAKDKNQIIKLSKPENLRLITAEENLYKQNKISKDEIMKYNLQNLFEEVGGEF